MNLTFNRSRQLTPRICDLLQIMRGTCKIAVDLDADLLTKLEQNELKPRHHPGVMKTGRLELPTQIVRALQCAIGDYPVKALLNECKQLNKYIQARHPPPEMESLRERRRDIAKKLDETTPPKKPDMSEEEEAAWQRKREQAIQRIMAERTYAWKPITYDNYQALTYAIGRSAQEYGVLLHILKEIAARDPQYKPNSYFDFGSGVGTGMWAASHLWKNSIFEYYNVDVSREMHDLSELIIRDGKENQQMTLQNVYYRQFLPGLETQYSLVVSAFSLFELPSAQHRIDTVINLWKKCDGYLVIVEEGTRRGSELVHEARECILGLKEEHLQGHVFAPCAHDLVCPRFAAIRDTTPCNFEVSYAPLRIGSLHADTLTARYSYIVLKKGAVEDPTLKWPRLVRPTLIRSKHVVCRMCTADAKLQEIIFTKSKHGRSALRCARASRWGDRLPITVGEPFETVTKKRYSRKSESQVDEANAEQS